MDVFYRGRSVDAKADGRDYRDVNREYRGQPPRRRGRLETMSGGESSEKPQDAVCVQDVRKVYETAGGQITALDGVSFSVEPGTVVGILGPNGAGKTTLIKCMLDLVRPTSGQVEVFGTDVHEACGDLYRRVSAMLEGARNVYWRLSVRENLYFFTSLQGIDPATVKDENLALVDALGLTDKLDEPVNSLSRGMKQKATLACTFARRTDVVFLDEPTLGLDVEAAISLRKTLREMVDAREKTVLLSSHDMDVVEQLCDRVIVVNDGRVTVDDSVGSLLAAFESQSHWVEIEESLHPDERSAIERHCETVSWTETAGYLELQATLARPSDYYDVVAELESVGATIRAAETTTPDLEEVFLRVTDDDRSLAAARVAGDHK